MNDSKQLGSTNKQDKDAIAAGDNRFWTVKPNRMGQYRRPEYSAK